VNDISEIIGWVGTVMVVTAYYLVSTKKVTGTNRYYQLLNLFGAIGIGANVFHQQAWPALALQVVWGIIAIISLCCHAKKE
jgi:hypothetical protein